MQKELLNYLNLTKSYERFHENTFDKIIHSFCENGHDFKYANIA